MLGGPRRRFRARSQQHNRRIGFRTAERLQSTSNVSFDDDNLMSSKDDISRRREKEESSANEIEDAIETGKAAARALLAQMNGGGGDDRGDSEDAPDPDRQIQKVSFQKND